MTERTNKRDFKKTLTLIGRGLKHLFLHNGWLKLIAIVISLFLWAGLISQDESITRDKAFQEVKVSITGQEALKGNGFIVTSDLDNIYADFVAAVPQKQYENADASFYNIRLDLSRINKTGEQEIKLLSTKTNLYGAVNSNSISPGSVTVNVERINTRSIPVQAEYIDEEPEGWAYVPGECDPKIVNVSGPQSIVNAIFKAKCLVTNDDVEWTSGSGNSVPVPFEFYNKDQEILDTSNLSITSASVPIDTVMVSYNVLAKKVFKTEMTSYHFLFFCLLTLEQRLNQANYFIETRDSNQTDYPLWIWTAYNILCYHCKIFKDYKMAITICSLLEDYISGFLSKLKSDIM